MNNLIDRLKRLYHWTISLAKSRYASLALAVVAFSEASFFIIPPDVVLLPMCIARPKRSLLYASVATLFSTLGGVVGYFIGAYLFNSVGQWLLDVYHLQDHFDTAKEVLLHYQFFAIFFAALTPIPYKLLTITSGILEFNILTVIFASLSGRGLRFFTISGVVMILGDDAEDFIDRNFEKITIALFVLLVVLYLFFKKLQLFNI